MRNDVRFSGLVVSFRAFQREYVWKRDDAKQLLDSLIKEYPTGTMLTWETNKPPQLKGPHHYDEKQGAVRILLDGQQRITTLYMLIRGTIPPYYTLGEITNDTRGLLFEHRAVQAFLRPPKLPYIWLVFPTDSFETSVLYRDPPARSRGQRDCRASRHRRHETAKC